MPNYTIALLLCLSAACQNEMVPTIRLDMPAGPKAEIDGSELFAASSRSIWRLDLNEPDTRYWVEEWPLGREEIYVGRLFRSDGALCFDSTTTSFCRSDGEWTEEPDAVPNREPDTTVAVRLPRCFGCEEQGEAVVISDRIALSHTVDCSDREYSSLYTRSTCVEWHHEFVFYDLEVSDEEGLLVPMGKFSRDWLDEDAYVAHLSDGLVIWSGWRAFVFAAPTM
jgi:hypothetical protein